MNLAHCQQMMEDQFGKEAMTFVKHGSESGKVDDNS